MSLLKKYNEIVLEMSSKLDKIYNTQLETLKTFLKATEIEKHKALTNNEEDNKVLSLYEFKDGVLDILVTMVENGIKRFDLELIGLVEDLVIVNPPSLSGEGSVVLEDLLKKIYKKCFYFLFHTSKIEDLKKVKNFLEKQEIPDFRNVCLAILFRVDSWSSFDLEGLSTLSSPAVVYDLVKMFKDDFIEEIKFKLIKGLRKYINTNCNDLKHIYLIFSEINQFKFEELILKPVDGEYSNEYFQFIYSLIVDYETAQKTFDLFVSGGLFDTLRDGIMDIITMNIVEHRAVDPGDEEYVLHLIEIVVRILTFKSHSMEYIRLYFTRFIDPLMKYIAGGVGLKTKGSVLSFLDHFMTDEESKIGIAEIFKTTRFFKKENFFRDVEEEMKVGIFFSTPRTLKFLYYLDVDLSIECAIYSLRTEDVKTIRMAFDLFAKVDKDVSQSILINSKHIRMAMIYSETLTRFITRYQIENRLVLNDVGIISVIVSTCNPDFFKYVDLFDDFSLFYNGKFLDRISENKEEGLRYLIRATKVNIEACRFVEGSIELFNSFMEDFPHLSPLLCNIYDNMIDFDIENVEVSFKDGFKLNETPSKHLFTILSKKLALCYLTQTADRQKYITNKTFILKDECVQSYMLYLKTRLMLGDNVESLVSDFVSFYDSTGEMAGYYKIVTGNDVKNGNTHVLTCLDKKDNKFFVKNYHNASPLERFLLYFTLSPEDSYDLEVKNIIKEEVTRISLLKRKSVEDKMILRQYIYSLLEMKNIDSIVRLINDCDDINLLLKLNIRNIMTGGMYFNPTLAMKGSVDLQVYAVFILYYHNVWDHSLLKDWIVQLYKENRSNKELEYLVADINRKNEYGFEIQLL